MDPAGSRNFRPREDRRRIVLQARLRNASGWSDACILNISSRGLMIYSNAPAQLGSFIELRRGDQLVIARVVWRQNQRIGLSSQDRLPVEQIISSETASIAAQAIASELRAERRSRERTASQNRQQSRSFEFVSLVLFGASLAGAAGFYVQGTLGHPFEAVEQAMGSR
jgi:hypothetical protein